MTIAIHPKVDRPSEKGDKNFKGGLLTCKCTSAPIVVKVDAQVAFNHACGCSKCWKPEGAIFSVVGVVSKDKVSVVAGGEKLKVVDPAAVIQRHACVSCGTHMFGRIENKEHAFHGLDFIHTELSTDKGWEPPAFAAFVSSVIESGTAPDNMADIRETLQSKGLEPYDCLSPNLMDLLAIQSAKAKGTYRAT